MEADSAAKIDDGFAASSMDQIRECFRPVSFVAAVVEPRQFSEMPAQLSIFPPPRSTR